MEIIIVLPSNKNTLIIYIIISIKFLITKLFRDVKRVWTLMHFNYET